MNGFTYHTERGYRFPLGGYRYDLEQSRLLQTTSTDVSRLIGRSVEAPKQFDPRFIFGDAKREMTVEDQGQQGACAGFSVTSCVEYVSWIATGGMIQLSNAYSYYAAQKEDGISGDQGSTINGCAKVARTYGVPRENSWPYPPQYNPRPPDSWEKQYERAKEFRPGSHTFLTSAQDTVQYLRAGVGGVQIGISWGGEVDGNGEFQWRAGGGGHSVALFGHKEDRQAGMYVWLLNSWGQRWGRDGWALVSIDTLARMLQHEFSVFVGYSDMENPDRVRDLIDLRKRPVFA